MPPLPALQPDYHDRHVKLLGKLGSDCETERATAARLADEHRGSPGSPGMTSFCPRRTRMQ